MSSASGMTLLRANEVTVRRGRRVVVHDASLVLKRGEIVALLGPNGAGKSTLLDALAGALPTATGSIEHNGRIAIALQSADLARRSVIANIALALGWWGVPRRERTWRALAALEALGAEHLAQRAAGSLSGGERRRVHLARAIAVDPDILLLDEPFAGLDAEARARLLEDSVSALRSPQRATLVVVHDRAEAWALADRLLILIEGQIVAEGGPQQLLEQPPSATVARFLGYDGRLREPGQWLLTRPSQVVLDPTGPIQATVARAVALEDAFRLELELPNGRLFAVAALPAPRVGDMVRLRLLGGARFPETGEPSLPFDLPSIHHVSHGPAI
jgi:ABC-type sulfate/molybdate transport systems ATPase subunit